MNPVFADTGYWIALWNRHDGLHERAKSMAARIESRLIVTTEMVLTEVLDHSARQGRYKRELASRMVRGIRANNRVRIIETTSELFWNPSDRYVDRYAARPDQSWSLTDCASFLTMETLGIDQAWPTTATSSRPASSPSSATNPRKAAPTAHSLERTRARPVV